MATLNIRLVTDFKTDKNGNPTHLLNPLEYWHEVAIPEAKIDMIYRNFTYYYVDNNNLWHELIANEYFQTSSRNSLQVNDLRAQLRN